MAKRGQDGAMESPMTPQTDQTGTASLPRVPAPWADRARIKMKISHCGELMRRKAQARPHSGTGGAHHPLRKGAED